MISCNPPTPDVRVAARAVELPKGNVVLVHGLFDTPIIMRPLRKAIVGGGYECLIPSLKPVDGRRGLEPLARQLRDVIDQEWNENAEFSVVAFSMGGLVARYYLQELGGAARCKGLYTIATPHNGTYTAYLYPGLGAKQMRPESAFLASLKKGASIFEDIPATSYRSPLDVVMLPTKSPKWTKADNVRFWSAVHPSLMWEKELHADLLNRLGQHGGDKGQANQATIVIDDPGPVRLSGRR
ncbi:MAG: alpha/beta fold hydrolase [Roseibacillus sp.]